MAECAEVEVVEFDCENCGYNHTIDGVRKREFARLGDITYLDHAGTTLYAQSQLDNYYKDLSDNVYGNPHSHNASSQLTTDTIEQIRYRVLKHFNTTPENHTVIFTSGCTASLKLLAESFDWYGGNGVAIDSSYFCYLEDNHTSVVGMREIAAENGAQILCLSLEEFTSSIQLRSLPSTPKTANCLFAYAAQCNFSGRRNPLEWADSVKSQQFQPGNCYHGKWYVALDAASHVTTAFLDLSSCRADFVTISFYKMFGLPTGLGALIVRNDVAHLLKKTYFGGGTVLVSINKERFHVPRPSLHERFEDGTVSFLDIISLKHGFDAFTRLAALHE
ncbi:molybdenum cofactor sulfurase-like [Saccoglossus kowalevskii]